MPLWGKALIIANQEYDVCLLFISAVLDVIIIITDQSDQAIRLYQYLWWEMF